MTSRRAVEQAERLLGERPLGHTGTLDPLASGILVVLGGEARKFQSFVTDHDKVYEARVVFGIESGSEDAEGPLWCRVPRCGTPELADIEATLERFVGGYEQVPPRLSAIRVGGQRAYERARRGEDVDVPSRNVRIDAIEIVSWEAPIVTLRVACGPGTYIRSLARDLGDELGCGAFLAGLRRTGLGAFAETDATPLSQLTPETWRGTEEMVAGSPRVEVSKEEAARLSLGQVIPMDGRSIDGPTIVWSEGSACGIVEPRGDGLQPRRWLKTASKDTSGTPNS